MAGRSPEMLVFEPASLNDVGVARRFVRNALDGAVPDDVSSDLQLITSELVTNAVEHGQAGSVRVLVTSDRRSASVTISSPVGASQVADVADWTIAGPTQRGGRGLGIVRSVADEIDVVRDGESLAITAARTFQPTSADR